MAGDNLGQPATSVTAVAISCQARINVARERSEAKSLFSTSSAVFPFLGKVRRVSL